MHKKHASSTSSGCATDGVDPAFQTGHSSSSSDGSCDPVRDEEQKASLEGPSREVPGAATAGMGDGDAFAVEGSEAVRLLDEELEELEKLILFQRKKIDALGRLRRQWLTGERNLPDVPLGDYREAYLPDAASAAPASVLDEERRVGVPDRGRGQGDTLPAAAPGRFEHYMMPYVRFPFTSRVVAMKVLSFRLKGSGRSPGSFSKRGGGGGDRSGFLSVFASLHSDGMVRLRDSDGEEILAFDSGHGHGHAIAQPPLSPAASVPATPTTATTTAEPPETTSAATTATTTTTTTTAAMMPPAIGLTGDSSEGDPVLVTAGADGTVRVHALTVRFRGKRVAGGRGGKKNKPLGSSSSGGGGAGSRRHEQQQQQQQQQEDQVPSTAGEAPKTSAGDSERNRKTRNKKGSATGDARDGNRDGSRDGPLGSPPPTARGIGMTAKFRVCLGSECGRERGPQDERTVKAAADEDAGVGPDDEGETGAAQSLPDGEEGEVVAVTSMDAYYHRALATTVVVAGYATGGVRLFHGGNGTLLSSAEADGGVLAVKRSGQTIAYSDGQDVRFASAANLQRTVGRVCRGGWGTSGGGDGGGGGGGSGGDKAAVTALAFDAVSPEILYVGAETGEVMAFNSKVPEADRSHRCLPAYRLPPPPQWAPSRAGSAALGAALDGSLATATEQAAGIGGGGGGGGGGGSGSRRVRCDAISAVRGYAIVSQGPLLSVYNTTGDTRLLFSRQHVSESEVDRAAVDAAGNEWGVEGALPVGYPKWFVMPSSGGDVLVAEAALPGAEMSVYKGALPHERNGPDMGWMRAPVIILGLFIVAITQVYSRRKATSFVGKTRRPGRNWREGDDDDGIEGMLAGNDNDNDEDFGIGSGIVGGLGTGLGLGGGTRGRQDWRRLMSDQSPERQGSPPRRAAPPSPQGFNGDLWERDSSD